MYPQCGYTFREWRLWSKHLNYPETLFAFGYLMFCFLPLQKELGFKVQIFEKKVESHKKTIHKLNNTVEYIKVESLSRLTVFIEQQDLQESAKTHPTL